MRKRYQAAGWTMGCVLAAGGGAGLPLGMAEADVQPILIERAVVLPGGSVAVDGHLSYEEDREATPDLEYDTLRLGPLGARFGLGEGLEVGGHLTYVSNSDDDDGAPDDSGLEGISLFGKLQLNRHAALTAGITVAGDDDVAPYPNDGIDFFVNLPVQRAVGDGLVYGEFGYTVQDDDVRGSYFNYGVGYGHPITGRASVNVELVGDEMPTAPGNAMDLVFGVNWMAARNLRVGPYLSVGLYDASPDVAIGSMVELRM